MQTPLTSSLTDHSPAAAGSWKQLNNARTVDDAADFAKVLGRWSPKKSDDPALVARQAAEELVAVTFVQPLLKELRDTNHAAEPFAPTQGEKQFQSLSDAVLAQRLVKASNFPLVDRLASDLLKNRQPEPAAQPPSPALKVTA